MSPFGKMRVGDTLDGGIKGLFSRLFTLYAIELIVSFPVIILQLVIPFVTQDNGAVAGRPDPAFAIATLGAGSYGMYLGRVMRWNSWDALLNIDEVALSVLRSLIDRPSSPGMFKITAVFALFLICAYATLYAFTRVRRSAV